METKIENLRWKPMWVSHLGCIKGCIEYLNMEVTDAWLFGATGHAFIINMHEVVCPSGPTAWCTEELFELGKNVGYVVDGICTFKSQEDFAEKQRLAWENTKQAIDEGIPCYGWELEIPEFYVVYGYDDKGYYFSGPRCDAGKGPKPWKELGETGIGVLEMYRVKPGTPSDDVTAITDAFGFVLEHCKSPEKWIFPKYKAGLAGYDSWLGALEDGSAHPFGMAYNAQCWNECRQCAVAFLREAKERLDGSLASQFDEAISRCETVAQNLKKVAELFPFKGPGVEPEPPDDATRTQGLESLRAARSAEEQGLEALKALASAL